MKKMLIMSFLFGLLALPSLSNADNFKPVVLYHWTIKGNSYNASIHRGVQRFIQETGSAVRETVVKGTKTQYIKDIEQFAQQGYSPIFLLYGQHYPRLRELSQSYPATRFIVFENVLDEPNMYSFVISDNEGAFLAGAIAAMASKTGIIGYVSVNDNTGTRRFLCGYEQGARYISSSVKVLADFTHDRSSDAWLNGDKTRVLANAQLDKGADVLFPIAGGAGLSVLEAAANRGKLAIGVDVNQNALYPGSILTSVLKRTDMASYAALMLAKRGVWRDNLKRLGLSQGAVGLAFDEHNEPLITQEMRERLERIQRDINAGVIKVHDYSDDNACPQ